MTTKLEQAARALLAKWDAHPYSPWREVGFISGDVSNLREALAEPELNLNCKSVQKRLATSWGYVKAEQQEQVAEWGKLKDPQTLFVNLNRGFPAQLTHDHLLHLLNKTEQAEQEPVALHKVVAGHIKDLRACVPSLRQYPEMNSTADEVEKAADELEAALNTAPPQKPWVSLTDDEIDKVLRAQEGNLNEQWFFNYARAVIAADRSKNGIV